MKMSKIYWDLGPDRIRNLESLSTGGPSSTLSKKVTSVLIDRSLRVIDTNSTAAATSSIQPYSSHPSQFRRGTCTSKSKTRLAETEPKYLSSLCYSSVVDEIP